MQGEGTQPEMTMQNQLPRIGGQPPCGQEQLGTQVVDELQSFVTRINTLVTSQGQQQ